LHGVVFRFFEIVTMERANDERNDQKEKPPGASSGGFL
jgi:hypothetical protein